jgi:DNA-binding NtrC family response regulator
MDVRIFHSNPLLMNILHDFLHKLGHSVFAFTEWNEKLWNMPLPDVFILELERAYSQKFFPLKKINDPLTQVPTIIINKMGTAIPAKEAFGLGIWGYIREPVCLEELEILLVRLNNDRPYC